MLGLSLAEVFLILLFLLLLATIGYSTLAVEEMEVAQEEIDRLSREIEDTKNRAEAAENERDALTDQLAGAKRLLGNIIGKEGAGELIAGQQEKIEQLEAKVDQLTPMAKLGHEVYAAARTAGVKPGDVPEIIAILAQAEDTINDLESQLSEVTEERDELLERVEWQAEDKGQYPPCWYVRVNEADGKQRERALYIFDVRISDKGIFVKDIPAPTPEYASQKVNLPFNRSALNKDISFDEFIKNFTPLKDAGDHKQVQKYSCKFYVKVWNATTSVES